MHDSRALWKFIHLRFRWNNVPGCGVELRTARVSIEGKDSEEGPGTGRTKRHRILESSAYELGAPDGAESFTPELGFGDGVDLDEAKERVGSACETVD
ncbi:hypothetical protein ACFX1W_028746 [Malus domestica]